VHVLLLAVLAKELCGTPCCHASLTASDDEPGKPVGSIAAATLLHEQKHSISWCIRHNCIVARIVCYWLLLTVQDYPATKETWRPRHTGRLCSSSSNGRWRR
jgi:hypothetical protein